MRTKNYWHRFQRSRITRRRLLVTSGVTAGGLAVFVACGDGGGDGNGDGDDGDATAVPTEAVAGTPVRGGQYISTVAGDWGTIDPVTSVGPAVAIFGRLYNTLMDRSRRDPEVFYMDMAESFEQVDEETYNYTMRPGVKIAPNTLDIPERDLDSGDAKAWLERIQQDQESVNRDFTNQWLQSFEAADPQTFQIKTNGPYAYFLFSIGSLLGGTMPPREFFEQGIDLKGQGVGAGPFKIQAGTFQESGEIVMERNPNYYRLGDDGMPLPYVDEIKVVRLDDRQARRTAFIDGQIHQYGALDRDEVVGIESQVPDMQIFEDPANTFISFTMNPTKPPWDDERIRKAAMFALNRQEFVDVIVGPDGGQLDGLVHWSVGGALPPEELEQLQPFDPEESRRLIQEATGQDTISIKVLLPVSDIEFHDQHLLIWRQQMAAAGFDLDEEIVDFGLWLERYTNVDYDSSLALNQVYETPEVNLDFHTASGPQGDGNFAIGIGELFPEIDAAVLASKQTADPEQLAANVQDVQRQIYEKGPAFLPIMTWNAFTLRQGVVKNWPRGLGGTAGFLNEWWLEGAL